MTTRQAPKDLLFYKFDSKDVGAGGLIADHGALGIPLQTSGAVTVDGQATFDGQSTVWSPNWFSYGGGNVLTAECFAKFTAEDYSAGNRAMLFGGSGEPGYNPGTFHLSLVGGETPYLQLTLTYQGNWDCNHAYAGFTPDGQWHHFAVVFNPNEETGKAAYLYIDHQLATSLDWARNGDNYKPFSLGWGMISIGSVYNDSRYYFKGQIDDVRVYNRALTPDQFLQKRDKGFNAFIFLVR